MQERQRTAKALRNGQMVAENVTVIERMEIRTSRVSLPGTGTAGRKDQPVRHPTTAFFADIVSGQFRAQLQRLAQASVDAEIGRRDRQWRPAPVVLEFDDGQRLTDVALDRPLLGVGPVERIGFNVRHEAL